MKHEKKYCLGEFQCNLMVMKQSQAKVLRLNLVKSPKMASEVNWPLSFESEACPKHKKNRHVIRRPFVTLTSNLEHDSLMTTTDIGTSSISSSDLGASTCLLARIYECLKEHTFTPKKNKVYLNLILTLLVKD